jgi:hypothetical protein
VDFPERAGELCFKKCPIKEVPYLGKTSKRKVLFSRDFAGTCWESCKNVNEDQTSGVEILEFQQNSGATA